MTEQAYISNLKRFVYQMSTRPSNSRPLAVLIDGDNAQPSLIEHIFLEITKYGIATTRRIYGDWTTPQMSAWKDSLHSYAVQPIQQFRYTVGKNATDSVGATTDE